MWGIADKCRTSRLETLAHWPALSPTTPPHCGLCSQYTERAQVLPRPADECGAPTACQDGPRSNSQSGPSRWRPRATPWRPYPVGWVKMGSRSLMLKISAR